MSKQNLNVESVQITKLVEDPVNARLHDKANIASIKASLRKFGQVEPLVVRKSDSIVIGGNGRLAAMKELGWKKAEIVQVDLDEQQSRALALALNRTAELAEWDYKQLSEFFKEFEQEGLLDDLAIGWEDFELKPLLSTDWEPPDAEGNLGDDYSQDDKPALTIKLTKEQADIFNACLEKVALDAESEMTNGEVLAAICRDFLND